MDTNTSQRVVASLKGYNYGIPTHIQNQVYNTLIADIKEYGITSIMFDGDLLTYGSDKQVLKKYYRLKILYISIIMVFIFINMLDLIEAQTMIMFNSLSRILTAILIILFVNSYYPKTINKKMKPVKSFTLLIPRLQEWSEKTGYNLEFIYGKKSKSIKKLLNGAPIEMDKHGTYLGPYKFLDENNTYFLDYNMEPPSLTWGINLAIGMDNDIKWDQLGLNLMQWINKADVKNMRIYTIGQGEVVLNELTQLEKLGDKVPKYTIIPFEFIRDRVP